jgi:hypothetical protein
MGQVKLANNAYTTLAVGCTTGATTLSVTGSTTFPAVTTASGNWFYACLQDTFANLEIVKVTDVTGTVWTVTRGIGGTTALAFPSGTVVELRVTAETIADILVVPGATINGGTINNTPIGNTTPSTGAFTTLSASGTVSLADGGAVVFGTGLDTFVYGSHTASYVRTRVTGTDVLNVTSTGLAVTGVTTSGGTDNAFGLSVTSATSDLQFTGYSSAVTGAVIEARRGATYKNLTLNGTTITIGSTGAGSATVSSTGLSVTGALSATGALTTGGSIFNAAPSGNQIIQTSTGTYATGLGLWAGGSAFVYSSAGITFKIGAAISGGIPIGGTDAATLDTSGNLGLGVGPSAWLSNRKILAIGGAAVAGLNFQSAIGESYYNCYYTSSGTLTYQNTGYAGIADFNSRSAGGFTWNLAASGTTGNPITCTQAMTLDASGNLLVGTTSAAASNSNSFVVLPAAQNVYFQHISGTGGGTAYQQFNYNSGAIGSITQSGTTAVLYNTTSDQRLKENIADADSANQLIDAIQVRQYDWKSDGSHQRYGFVAQELVEVYPEAVHQPVDPEAMMAVDYSKLVPLLVKEIQQLRARLNAAGIA